MDSNKLIDDTFKTDFSISHSITTSWTMKKYHFHELYEIYFSLSDNISCFINDKIYKVEKGDLFLFTPEDFHKIVVPPNTYYERYYILFNPQYVEPLSTLNTDLLVSFKNRKKGFSHRIHLDSNVSSDIITLFDKAYKCSSSNEYGSDVEKKMILAEILIFINKCRDCVKSPPATKPTGDYDKVLPIIDYIDKHLADTLTLDILSSKFFISKFYMENIFKNTTGFSINEYIINKRIMKSKEMLKKNMPVAKVAELVGFNSDSHFIRTFKKLVKISPKQYTKMLE